jgi:CDP-diacylglycerol--serine O-phosphatidyltransferase
LKSFIPNALTASNLVLGVFSIISTLHNDYTAAALFIVAALIADGLDGRVARFFNASSEFGKELDSLCDLASFGVAPAILAYSFLLKDFGLMGYIIAAFFAVCGALRLARFNVNTSIVKGFFMGLPIPAGGCAVATFVMLGIKPPGIIFPAMVAVFAYLMVSTIHYPDFKGKGGKTRMMPAVLTLLCAGYILFAVKDAQTVLFIEFFSYALFGILDTVFSLFDKNEAA